MDRTFELYPADMREAQSLALRRACHGLRGMMFWSALLTYIPVGIGLSAAIDWLTDAPDETRSPMWILLGAFAAAWAISQWSARRLRARMLDRQVELVGPFPLLQTVALRADGLHISTRFGASQILWSAVVAVEALPRHIGVALASGYVTVLPHAAFSSDEERDTWLARLRQAAAET